MGFVAAEALEDVEFAAVGPAGAGEPERGPVSDTVGALRDVQLGFEDAVRLQETGAAERAIEESWALLPGAPDEVNSALPLLSVLIVPADWGAPSKNVWVGSQVAAICAPVRFCSTRAESPAGMHELAGAWGAARTRRAVHPVRVPVLGLLAVAVAGVVCCPAVRTLSVTTASA